MDGDRIPLFDEVDPDPVVDDHVLLLPRITGVVDEPPHADEVGGVLHGDAVREEPELGFTDEVVVDLRSGEEVGR